MPKEKTKRIVVTGCSHGLGEALVEYFIAQGHIVIGCARSKAKIAELQKKHQSPHSFTRVDVSDDVAVAEWAKQVLFGGPVDLLINNAAIMNRLAPLWEQSTDEFNEMFRVNVLGMANCIRHFVPAMVKRESGVIVNLSSGWGRSVSPNVAPYCSTKYAVEGMTLALAEELPAGMCAVPLNPGTINTPMLKQAWGDDAEHHTSTENWVKRAGPFILQLSAKDNGHSLNVPKG